MRIAINRTDALGDTLLTMPMALAIKNKYPEAKIYLVTNRANKELLKNNNYLDDIFVVNPADSVFKRLWLLRKEFKKWQTTHYFYFGGKNWPSLSALLAGVPWRGGLKSRWPTFFLLNKGIRQSRRLVVAHEAEYNLALVKDLGIDWTQLPKQMWRENIIATTIEEDEQARQLILQKYQLDINQDFILCHPGMTGHTLNWPAKNYARLLERLQEALLSDANSASWNFVVGHGSNDQVWINSIKDFFKTHKLQKPIIYFDGQENGLRNYMSLIKKAGLFIGPSTGPTHIASLLGRPVVTLFSPIKVQSARRWRPLELRNEQVKVIVPDVICGESHSCAGQACPYYECMSKVEVNDVVKTCVDQIQKIK